MADEAHVAHAIDGEREVRRVDAAIAALAKRQHGIVARGQLTDLGLGRGAIEHRVRCGRLHPLHRGVYAVGHRALRREAWWLATVLAAGPGAALSYRSAAELWGMRYGSRARVEVSVPRHRRSTARIEVHVVEMQPDEVTVHDGIPVTTPARTLLDLAAVVPPQHLKAAFEEAEVRRLTSPTSLDAWSRGIRSAEGPPRSRASSKSTTTAANPSRRASSSAASSRSSTPMAYRARRSITSATTASSTPHGTRSASSSSATASPRMAHAKRSSVTGRRTGRFRSPAGASSGSRGAS
jgi:hypothetical protein